MGNENDTTTPRGLKKLADDNPLVAAIIAVVMLSSGVSGGVSGLFNGLIDHRTDPWTGKDAARQQSEIYSSVASSIAKEADLRAEKHNALINSITKVNADLSIFKLKYTEHEKEASAHIETIQHNEQDIADLEDQIRELNVYIRGISNR